MLTLIYPHTYYVFAFVKVERSLWALPFNILYNDLMPSFSFSSPVACNTLKVQPADEKFWMQIPTQLSKMFHLWERRPIRGQFVGPRQKRDYIRQLLLVTSDCPAAFWST